ncbi:MAG: insulinase family protein [Spirochaetia bacterium]|jgi:Zn-dependent M16 (insulinase) family peptidase|nr:insulinase family protein [Spirochaetia bacterium]
MQIGEIISGFILESIDNLSEFNSEGRFFRHIKTGCELYHVFNNDPENLFSFIFKTIPFNSKGTAHIVEHSVLSGSQKFPLKDPFVQLLKSSMYTFLNAMTYPDKTVYPASSTVEADYFNLMSVYGDAVFFPLFREATFLQEGVRVNKNNDGSYTYGGVVYNEMKGNYSEHNSVLAEWSTRSLFPDTAYRFDSGGDPQEIKDLSYSEFRDFHAKYYHPANARIFLYGNIDTEKQLDFIDSNFLSRFSYSEKGEEIQIQKKLDFPVYLEKTAHSEEGSGATSITINWLCGSSTDPLEALQMEILSELLIGNSGAPLYLSLINSGIGEDLSPVSGADTGIKQIIFTVGVRGTEKEKRGEFEKLVFDSLEEIAEKGFDPDLVEGVLRQFEFAHREIKGGRPLGLKLMIMSCQGWLHSFNPDKTLLFTPLMDEVRSTLSRDSRFFEKLIREKLLSNNHRSIVTVMPDNNSAEKPADVLIPDKEMSERGDRESAVFGEYQGEKDSEEDLAKIPVLGKKDIPEKVEIIPYVEKRETGDGCFLHSFYTAGITYTALFYDISTLDEELKIYLPLFSKFIRETGLPGIPYYETARMMNLKAGGFYVSPETGKTLTGNVLEILSVHFKSLTGRYGEAADFIFDILSNADFSDLSRLKDIIMEMVNDLKASVVKRGNYTATLYASKDFSPSLSLQEKWSGISQLFFLQSINTDDKKDLETTAARLLKIKNYISKTPHVLSSLTSDENDIAGCYETLKKYLPAPEGNTGDLPFYLKKQNISSGSEKSKTVKENSLILVPSMVSYNAAVFPAARVGCDEYVHEKILSRIIETGFLWDRIRMDGGAYGVGVVANGMEGLFGFSSYRDPNVEETQNIFYESLTSVSEKSVTEEILLKAVVSGIGREIRPLAPGEKGVINIRRKIYGLDDDLRQKSRNVMLDTEIKDIAASADMLRSEFLKNCRCVLTGRESYEKYKKYFAVNNFKKITLDM